MRQASGAAQQRVKQLYSRYIALQPGEGVSQTRTLDESKSLTDQDEERTPVRPKLC